MKKFKEFAEVEAMVGQTYGEGKDARTVTRITNIHDGSIPGASGTVYWRRPGGKERRVGKYLPHFMEWIDKINRDSKKVKIENVGDIEDFLSNYSELAEMDGHIVTHDNKVTIVFEVKK